MGRKRFRLSKFFDLCGLASQYAGPLYSERGISMGFNYKIIAVDFDGTLCTNKWPEIGKPNKDLILYLKEHKRNGGKLILWTNRVEERLNEAVAWCREFGLIFDAVNANLQDVIDTFGSDCRKVFAHEYIDDRMYNGFNLPFVDVVREESGE